MTWRLCLFAAALSGCGSSSRTADTSESEPDASTSVDTAGPIAAAKQICATIETCDELEPIFSERACVDMLSEQFADDAEDCYECLAELTCAGLRALNDDLIVSCEVCSDCRCRDAGAPAVSCIPGVQSMPHSAGDPCPQNEPTCPYPMYTAVTTCMLDGRWSQTCQCVLTSSLDAGTPTRVEHCGNGRLDPGEQCDPGTAVSVTATCPTLMPGTTGTVTCHPAGGPMACMLNLGMCTRQAPPPSGGAGSGSADADGGA